MEEIFFNIYSDGMTVESVSYESTFFCKNKFFIKKKLMTNKFYLIFKENFELLFYRFIF